ncbi:conserved protein of unknown function [Ectopseudomonas oleovorans]|uniref:Uncharacterized protein n=1 Tax=Ectopseudomonas oleovorans TaxID=301 RepID=A0A653B409_ECTOL|nr:conserved protein of unknown function [Pseudomonas oleovorans]
MLSASRKFLVPLFRLRDKQL